VKYYSCPEIEGAIHFYKGIINFCCTTFGDNRGFVKMADYTGGPIQFDLLERAKLRLIRQNNSKGNSPCRGCSRLEYKEWDRDKTTYDQIAIGPYSLCNLTCNYCYMNSYKIEERREVAKPLYDILDALKQLIDKKKIGQQVTLVWAGGEPVLYREFEDIFKLFEDNNITVKSYIYSNCTIFSPIILKGIKEGRITLNCSIDSGSKETYLRIKRVDLFDTVKENLRKYIQANPDNVVLKYILTPDNWEKEELDSFISLCNEIEAKNIFISKDIFKPNAPAETKDKVYSSFAYLVFQADKHNIASNTDVFTAEELFEIKLRISEKALACNYPDIHFKYQFGNLIEDYRHILSSTAGKDVKPAEEIVKNASESDEDNGKENIYSSAIKAFIEAGNNAIKWKGNYSEAISQYMDALKIDPENPEAYYLLGKAYQELNNLPDAISSFESSINYSPLNKKYAMALANSYLLVKEVDSAMQTVFQYLFNYVNDSEINNLVEKIAEIQEQTHNEAL
jgi:sulfatase maturation enzyme AslB (radical SAM superfamily)